MFVDNFGIMYSVFVYMCPVVFTGPGPSFSSQCLLIQESHMKVGNYLLVEYKNIIVIVLVMVVVMEVILITDACFCSSGNKISPMEKIICKLIFYPTSIKQLKPLFHVFSLKTTKTDSSEFTNYLG